MATDKPQANYNEVLAGIGVSPEDIQVYGNEVMIATYMRPNVTPGGIILTDKSRDEDQWQGKVGIVLKKGPLAFVDNERLGVDFGGMDVEPGDLVMYRVSDGFPFDLNGVHCRMLADTEIRLRVPDATLIY